uniref:DUF554 family protein n=1 Tax=Klebsiella aerogenes TaxID=548 RepID=UPI0038783FF9
MLVGGVLGALLSQRLPERIRTSMTSIFGLASLGIGILLVIKCANLPVMVLATLVIPSRMAPKTPVPLAQNSTMIAT